MLLPNEVNEEEINKTAKRAFFIYVYTTLFLTLVVNLFKDSFTHSEMEFVIGLNLTITLIMSFYYLYDTIFTSYEDRYASATSHFKYLYVFGIFGILSLFQSVIYINYLPTLTKVPATEFQVHVDSRSPVGSLSLRLSDGKTVTFKKMSRKYLDSLDKNTVCDVLFSKGIEFPYVGVETYNVYPVCRQGMSKIDKSFIVR